MDLLAPLGPVYQAGTLSGNPVTMAAGTATLSLLDERAYNRLDKMGAWLASALADAILRAGIPGCVQRVGSMFTIFFGIDAPASLAAVQRADHEAFRRFFFGMLDRGFYLPPSPFEASFLSLAHSDEDLEAFVAAVRDTLRIMQ